MNTYEFELKLKDIKNLNPKIKKALSEAGCHDAQFGCYNQIITLGFARKARNRNEAINGAVSNIRKAGYDIAPFI